MESTRHMSQLPGARRCLRLARSDPVAEDDIQKMDHTSEAVRRQMIAEAAYFRAEQRGFSGGDPVSDWLEAEEEIDAGLGKRDGASGGLEDRLATANAKLRAFRKQLAQSTAEARGEWEADIQKLAALRDRLRRHIREIRAQTGNAAEKLKPQADKIRDEMTAVIERLKQRGRS